MLAHMLGLATVLRGTWIYNHAEQLYTVAALVLDASTCVAAAAGSSLIDVHLHCVVDMLMGLRPPQRAHARCCEEADLASLGWICDAEKRCTDAALVLDAFTRVAAAAGSSLIDLHLNCVVVLETRWIGLQVASTVLT